MFKRIFGENKSGITIYSFKIKQFCDQINKIFTIANTVLHSSHYIDLYYSRSFDRAPILIHYHHKERIFKIKEILTDKEVLDLIKYWPRTVTVLEISAVQNKKISLILKKVKWLERVTDMNSQQQHIQNAFNVKILEQGGCVVRSKTPVLGYRFKNLLKVALWDFKLVSWDSRSPAVSLRYRYFFLKPLGYATKLKYLSILNRPTRSYFDKTLSVTIKRVKPLESNWLKLHSLDFNNGMRVAYNDIQVFDKQQRIMWLKEFKDNDPFSNYRAKAFEGERFYFKPREYYSY